MFNIGPAEILIIGLVLLIAVGPEQLPGVIRRAGSTVAQFRSMTDGLRSEFMAGLDEIERATDIERWSGDDETDVGRGRGNTPSASAPTSTTPTTPAADAAPGEVADTLFTDTNGSASTPAGSDADDVGPDAAGDGAQASASSQPGTSADSTDGSTPDDGEESRP